MRKEARNAFKFLILIIILVSCTRKSETISLPLKTGAIFTFTPMTTPIPIFTVIPSPAGTSPENVSCIKSFGAFAYTLPDWDSSVKTEKILPLPPWQNEVLIPEAVGEDPLTNPQVEIARSNKGQHEIWLSRESLSRTPKEKGGKREFLIYLPELHEWKVVSAWVGETEIFVKDLFVANDGSVWGKNEWDPVYGNYKLPKVPVLSRFDEGTQRFEFAQGGLEIPFIKDPNYSGWPVILLDSQNMFWIFVNKDGIYNYNPASMKTSKQVSIPDLDVIQAALAPDGSIYTRENKFAYSIQDEELYRFSPGSDQMVPLGVPQEPWPTFSGMLVDHTGRLWMGAVGYLGSDGSWNLLYPEPEEYFKHAGDYLWSSPLILLESSDGILWFAKDLDTDIIFEGTAWYDPKTGEGCLFTNLPGKVVEDEEQNLWLAVENHLYKHELK